MKCFIIVLVFWLVTSTVGIAGCKLPADVSTRVGTGSGFIYNWTSAEYANMSASRDYYWNNQPDSRQGYTVRLPAGSFSSAYTAVNRVPIQAEKFGKVGVISACANRPNPGGCSMAWFQREHPNWIIYRHDQATPAYEFRDLSWIPLDISNPEVQSWISANEFAPLLAAGYQGISFDNVYHRNIWDEEGICSVAIPSGSCASNGGAWTQLYSGAVAGDRRFVDGRVAWLTAAAKFIHDRTGCISANVTYDPENPTGTKTLIDAVDIWYDEDGFTGDSNPSACSPAGGGSGSVGGAWEAKAKFVIGLNGGVGKPMVQENSICPGNAPHSQAKSVLEYALASYLLTKNAHTYVVWYFDDGKTGSLSYFNDPSPWPQLSWTHGAAREAMTEVEGVYRRTFEHGLALLNPSTNQSAKYRLSGAYRDFDGASYSGTVTLPPESALILINGAPPGVGPVP
jgi:hypothetical protein